MRILKNLTALLLLAMLWQGQLPAYEVSTIDEDGVVTAHPMEMDDRFKNPSTPEFEERFQRIYNDLIQIWTRNKDGGFQNVPGNKYAENEKGTYPAVMFHIVAGNVDPGVRVFEAADSPQSPRDNDHTHGIDLYWAFTLKGQVRKFFQFGHLLNPDYRRTMERAIDAWTKTHPRFTPHPVHQRYRHDVQGWGPNRFGHRQVDGRRTDNLYAMSTTSIYLFAEAAGNEETRLRAKSEVLGYVWALYNIGHGEWDSETYHPHIVSPYLNLYDFAKDPEVKLAAKAALDHFFTSAALKYQRGAYLGASKRDYASRSYRQTGSPFMKFFDLYFDGAPERLRESDQVFGLLSNYRPPQAVLALAHREFDRPVEILASKPNYENWHEGQSERPRNFETLWIGRHGGMGSVLDPGGNGDLAPFRIVLNRGEDQADIVAVSSRPQFNRKFAGCQTAQYGNLFVWMAPTSGNPWALTYTEAMNLTNERDILFLEGENSWIAIRTHGIGSFEPVTQKGRDADRFRGQVVRHAPTLDGADFAFLTIEIGEKGEHTSFEAFRRAIHEKSELAFDAGKRVVTLTGTDGRVLEAGYNPQNDLTRVTRDGVTRDWDNPAEWALWRTVGESDLISLGWKEGVLKVNAGGHSFISRFALDDHTGPEVMREHLEKIHDLSATITFENK